MTMENDARCSGGGSAGGSEGSEAGDPPSVPDLDDSSSEEHNSKMALATTSHTMPPSSRLQRNRAEKQRRDKLNTYIQELSTLNPLILMSEKKMDKTSVLRLSAAYLRLHRTVWHGNPYHDETSCCTPGPAIAATATAITPLPASLPSTPGGPRSDSRSSNGTVKNYDVLGEHKYFPHNYPLPLDVTDQMLEAMDGFMLILTSAGKVVYVSSSVGKLLGHSQSDLMGQLLYSITCPSDHEELRKNLQPDNVTEQPGSSNRENITGQRRSFYLKLSQRATSRGEHTQYELVHVVGHLRVPPPESSAPSNQIARKNTRIRDGSQSSQQNQHQTVLIAVAKMPSSYRRDLSMLDASKEEYISRHTLGGEIIYCDHRISVVAGYMAEEVTSISAFKYMHKEDRCLTMLSLKQMYTAGGGYGYSTYRLLCKNNEFIYLRTHGHLEYDESGNTPTSFICINTLLSEEEGEQGAEDMKATYSAQVHEFEAHLSEIMKNLDSTNSSSRSANQCKLDELLMLNFAELAASAAEGRPLDAQHRKTALTSPSLHLSSSQANYRHEDSRILCRSPGNSNSTSPLRNNISQREDHRNSDRHSSPNGSYKSSMGSHSALSPHSPNFRRNSLSSPTITLASSNLYSQNSCSSPEHSTADPMITGTGSCSTLLRTTKRQESLPSYKNNVPTTMNLVLETTPFFENVSSSTTDVHRNRRGRPPRSGQKRNLLNEKEYVNNKKVCTEEMVNETENLIVEDTIKQEAMLLWDNQDSPMTDSSLPSIPTDVSSIDFNEDLATEELDSGSFRVHPMVPSIEEVLRVVHCEPYDSNNSSPHSLHQELTTARSTTATITSETIIDDNSVHSPLSHLKQTGRRLDVNSRCISHVQWLRRR